MSVGQTPQLGATANLWRDTSRRRISRYRTTYRAGVHPYTRRYRYLLIMAGAMDTDNVGAEDKNDAKVSTDTYTDTQAHMQRHRHVHREIPRGTRPVI